MVVNRGGAHAFPGLWILILALCLGSAVRETGAAEPAGSPAQHLHRAAEAAGIHQFFQASPRIYSGSQPEGEASFAYLASLGVKTILSVDGSKPDVEAARKHGIRYVHLPYGYDGVPTHRVAELVKFSQETEGRVFVHCHHGKHRGPAAVALLCRSTEGWTSQQATQFMAKAGTSRDYPGLFQAAENFKPPTNSELKLVGKLPEISPTPKVVDLMVEIDDRYDRVKSRIQKIQEKMGKGQEVSAEERTGAASDSTLLWEQLHEHLRSVREANTSTVAGSRDAEYRRLLEKSEKAAEQLKTVLARPADEKTWGETGDGVKAKWTAVTQSCTECHRALRNRK